METSIIYKSMVFAVCLIALKLLFFPAYSGLTPASQNDGKVWFVYQERKWWSIEMNQYDVLIIGDILKYHDPSTNKWKGVPSLIGFAYDTDLPGFRNSF